MTIGGLPERMLGSTVRIQTGAIRTTKHNQISEDRSQMTDLSSDDRSQMTDLR